MTAALSDIKNFIQINERVATSGLPTAEQFGAVRAAGFKAVVNLLPQEQDNALKGEDELIRGLGMSYHYIPVVWTAPHPTDFARFCDTLQELGETQVLIHCAMNMRVTAFYSSYAMKHLGWSADQANALVARVWEANPKYRMDDTWRAFIARIRQ